MNMVGSGDHLSSNSLCILIGTVRFTTFMLYMHFTANVSSVYHTRLYCSVSNVIVSNTIMLSLFDCVIIIVNGIYMWLIIIIEQKT